MNPIYDACMLASDLWSIYNHPTPRAEPEDKG